MCMCCENPKIATISAKCSDKFMFNSKGIKYVGYVPYDIGIGGGEYISFELCLSCGKIRDFVENASDLAEFLEDNKQKETA